jgi:DNA-binding IscR family transcriptional regulator
VVMWNQLSSRIFDYLNGLTLAEAVNQTSESKEGDQGDGGGFRSDIQQTAA